MRILLINKFHYMSGGAERYVFDWADLLRRKGHEVVHFAMQHPRNRPSTTARYFVPQVSFGSGSRRERITAAFRSIYSFESRRRLSRLLRKMKPDIAHVHSYCYQLTPSIFTALLGAGVPAVQTAHEYKHICPNQRLYDQRINAICERCRLGGQGRGGRLYMPLVTRCIKGSLGASATGVVESYLDHFLRLSERGIRRIITPSNFMRRKMIEFGLQPAKIVHIPNFVVASEGEPHEASDPYILYAGRLVRHKGILTLVEAASELPGVRFLIAGEGEEAEDLKNYINRKGLRNVELLGFKESNELQKLLAGCRGAVVPSEWYENCPYSVLEPMAAGKPVVAARIGGIPELVVDGVTGFLFPPGDRDALVSGPLPVSRRNRHKSQCGDPLCEKLAALWDNPRKAAEMGRKARERARMLYNPEDHYSRVMAVFEDAIR